MPRLILNIEPPYTPEFLPEAAAAVEDLLDEDSRVFEFGSGYSTVWFAGLCDDVVTVEHDPQWAEEVERALREARRWSKVELVKVEHEDDIGPSIDLYGDFDLVLVDCLDRQRTEAVERAMSHVRPGGYLVLDDSHWSLLSVARRLLAGWTVVERYNGDHTRKSGITKAHQTTIYQRPLGGEEEE